MDSRLDEAFCMSSVLCISSLKQEIESILLTIGEECQRISRVTSNAALDWLDILPFSLGRPNLQTCYVLREEQS